jgi:hypothetical protein
MTQPTARTETLSINRDVSGAKSWTFKTDKFATAGDLTVTVTNNYDEPAEVYLEERRLANSSAWQDHPPAPTVNANGGSYTFDDSVVGSLGNKTYYRAVFEFDTTPSGTGGVSAEFEQLNEERGVVVEEGL